MLAVVSRIFLALMPEHCVEAVLAAERTRDVCLQRLDCGDGTDGEAAVGDHPVAVREAGASHARVEQHNPFVSGQRWQQKIGKRLREADIELVVERHGRGLERALAVAVRAEVLDALGGRPGRVAGLLGVRAHGVRLAARPDEVPLGDPPAGAAGAGSRG